MPELNWPKMSMSIFTSKNRKILTFGAWSNGHERAWLGGFFSEIIITTCTSSQIDQALNGLNRKLVYVHVGWGRSNIQLKMISSRFKCGRLHKGQSFLLCGGHGHTPACLNLWEINYLLQLVTYHICVRVSDHRRSKVTDWNSLGNPDSRETWLSLSE